ncbi:hypothetical protein ACHWQZ_G005757 [Mnemiopsis leidyi]
MTIGPRTSTKRTSETDTRIGCYHSTLTTNQLSSLRCSRSRNKAQSGCTRGEMSGHRRVSKLPSLKAPSPSTQNHLPTSPAPSTGSDETSLKEPSSRLFKRQTRSRRTSISSNENGSLTRDVHLSDFAFVEQLEDFRRQLLDLRKEKKKQEDEIIKYKLLCKEKHQNIQELHNKLEAEKANSYDLKDQLTRDLTLQLQSQHAADKKKLTFDISILKNDKRKMESEIRLLETTNKGLFEEIRQIRSSYDAKMEKLMKDFHIEIYKESGEKRRLEKKLQDTNEKLTKEEYLAKQAELERMIALRTLRDRAEEHARDARQRRTSTFGYETGTLDRQNKKIAELEETVRKLESLKTIAESQNLELLRKLKDAEKGSRGPVKKGIPKHDDSKDSPHTERKRNLNKVTGKEKIEAADKKLNIRDGKANKKDLENYLKLANKERNVLERKIALLEKTRQQTGDEKIDNEISALRQQHKELLKNISSKEKLLDEQDKDSDDNEDKKSKIPAPSSNLSLPGKRQIPRSPRTSRRISRSPSPLMMMKLTEDGEEEGESGKGKRKSDVGKKKQAGKRKDSPGTPGRKDSPGTKKDVVSNGNVVTIDRSNYTSTEQQTVEIKTPQKDQEIQVEIYEEEDDGMYDLNNFDGGAGQFMFQEPEVVESAPQDIPLGAVHSNDKLMEELEEQMETLQKLREKDMQKIASLSEKLEQYKVEVASLNRKAGSYYSELEANTSKLNTSLAEIDKLNGEIKHLQNLNSTMDDEGNGDFGLQGHMEKELAEAKKDVEQLTSDLREKQLTIMKLHQELHESSEELMDKSGMVRQLEALVDNLKHDKEIMREEQMNYETTTEEILDQLRTLKVRNNQLEELVKSLEADIETHKRDMGKLSDEKQLLQSEKERFEVETEDLSARMAARDMELETALSKNPTSEESQTTLNMLQEIRQKDNALKKLQKKHEETLMQVKKEVEKQVSHLQAKVSRRDDDLANLRADHNKERSNLMSQIGDLQSENTTLKDNVTNKEREIEEIYSSLASSEATVESKELNKRLAELANENMMLKDEINNYRDIVSDKRPKGFMGELGQRIQTQRPSYTGKVTPNVTISDQSGIEEEEEEDEEDIGEIQVALVLYSYDPTHMSPNDYPEDELTLTSGDFIYIFGDPDADGFFTAELMSGERGLVPSNFIQSVELNEKKTQQMRRMSQQRLSVAPVIGAPSSNSTNTDIPVPVEIQCEAIGTKTLELHWELPDTGAVIPILGFRIHVNSQEFKVTNTGECRTVLNELPPGRPLYISVQTISVLGDSRESKPCVYGREAIKAPQNLDVTNVTTNSAVLTFVGQAHYHHGVFVNGEHVITLQPGELLYMLRGLQADTQYEVRIVTLSTDDTTLINKKTFSCSQSTTFLTEISGDWKPPSPPTSIDLAPATPEDLQLNILDKDRIAVSWSAVQGAASYHIYLNSELERIVQPGQLKQTLYLSDLREQDDEQCFHVVALNSQGDRSLPSDTISFFKSELFSQLSYFFAAPEAGPSPPPSDPESEPGVPDNLPEEIKSRLLVRISLPPDSCDLQLGQVVCVERDSEGNYRTQVGDKTIHIPVTNVTNVPITRRVVALYDYHPSAMSPNPDSHNEISFMAGDVILVYGQDSEGFLKV